MTYVHRVLREVDSRIQPGTVTHVRVLHDPRCRIFSTKSADCDCQPEIEYYRGEEGLKILLEKRNRE